MLTASDLNLLQQLFEKNNDILRKEIRRDIQKSTAPLATKEELNKHSTTLEEKIDNLELRVDSVEKRQKKQYKLLNNKLNFITKFFDKELVDLRKQVAYISGQ